MDASSRNVEAKQLPLVPVIDLLSPGSAGAIADACRSHGFFKAVNHGMAVGITETLEAEAMAFFALSKGDKVSSSVGFQKPLGYGCGNIGSNGDVGSLEYLIVSDTHKSTPTMPIALCHALGAYMTIVQKLAGRVLELMAEGLGMEDTDVFRGMVHNSNELLRLNHYPPSLRLEAPGTGFGAHTDPQLMSLLRSNSVSGLQIELHDGTWLPIAPDTESVFISVGDTMEVLTNGRYRSVRHRVVAGEADIRSRLSMIYFGGPALAQKIVPMAGLIGPLELIRYDGFMWEDYIGAAYKTKLGDCRLRPFMLQLPEDSILMKTSTATAPE